ncbi:MAG: H/ACA RNA-protein complex protein Gar1 [Candidatus Methanomethylicota archaeon]|jgi:rRNA processing protein Gar1|uniref:H/ACA RNA-protein complex protein Gar1 n=1 Tax=Thermoproteota archaeon TaxID=2056631 RepID=A0A523BHB1_9CREN|nr:MAG: H/ACA RNA-protein complex protein Gar1 [Candidatus Verstraetearchaeota archaeon]
MNCLDGDDYLKSMGSILGFSKSKLLTVRVLTPPKIGSRLFLKNGSPVGTVIDVFGPVSSPYASVKPDKGIVPEKLVGAEVYWKEEYYRKRRKRDYAK